MQSTGTDATCGAWRIFQPPAERTSRTTGVIWCTGGGRDLADVLADPGTNLASELRIILGLAECFTVLVADLTDATTGSPSSGFGNAAQRTSVEAARQLLIAAGCDPVVGIGGISQGHACAVSFGAEYPARVFAVFGGIGGCNLYNVAVDNFLGTARAAVYLAAGVPGTYPAALPAGFDTADKAAILGANGTPWRMWAGDADAAVRIADARAFAAAYTAAGGARNQLTEVAGGGHDDTTLDAIDVDELRSWLWAQAA